MNSGLSKSQKEFIEVHSDDTGTEHLENTNKKKESDTFDRRHQYKHDIRAGPADIDALIKNIREFRENLRLIKKFHLNVEDQPKGQTRWEQIILPTIQNELTNLRQVIERWESPVGDDFEQALEPLWHNFETADQPFKRWGGIPTPKYQSPKANKPKANNEYRERVTELYDRTKALKRLLEDITGERYSGVKEDERLHKILCYIDEQEKNPNAELEGNRKFRASRVLASAASVESTSHLGLVEEADTWLEFNMTTRGEQVLEAFENVMQLSFYKGFSQQEKARELIEMIDALLDTPSE